MLTNAMYATLLTLAEDIHVHTQCSGYNCSFRAMHNFTKCITDALTRETGVRCSSEHVLSAVQILGPRLKADLNLQFNPEDCKYASFDSWAMFFLKCT